MSESYDTLVLLTPLVMEAVRGKTDPSQRAIALIDAWRTHGIVDFTREVVFDRAEVSDRVGTNPNHLRGAIELTKAQVKGDPTADPFLKQVRQGMSAWSRMCEWRKSKSKAERGPKKRKQRRERKQRRTISPATEQTRKKIMHLLKPGKSASNKDLKIWTGSSDEEYEEAKSSLLDDGLVAISRGRNGRVSRTEKSMRPNSPYLPESQEVRIAPEVSAPPAAGIQQVATESLKEDRGLSVHNVVLKHASNFNTALTVLRNRLSASGSQDEIDLVKFASEAVSEILDRVVNPTAVEQE